MRANIKIGLANMLPPALLAFFNHIIAKLTGNAQFPNLPMSLVDMTALSVSLQAAITAAIDGSSTDRAHRNAVVLQVQDVLRVTADYVRAECDGDAELLTTSGFPLAKQPESHTEVGIPKNVRADATDVSGEVKLLWGRTVAARMFRIEQATSDPTLGVTTWNTAGQVSRQRFIVTGLEPYKSYWFRIVALGIDKEGLPSDVVLGRPA
ncbi:MAG: fibronectin type III domain-containing protein [Flavobacteriales bacterium]|nr:fibronectin type III domain-containing protein [Flavobacteriales bacterium]